MSPIEPGLEAERLRDELRGCRIGCDILVLDETTSTNDFVFNIAKPETPEGLVVFAEQQAAGRGQHGKRWESAAGKGLWFSILLRPRIAPCESSRLTTVAAESVADVIRRELSLGARVKPPNDVYIGSRKVAGVLLEMRAVPGATPVGILGIGINVNHAPENFPHELRDRAGSLAMALGRPLDRHAMAVAFLRRLDETLCG